MILAFRLRGLPYTFLLTNQTIVEAFPLPVDKKQGSDKGGGEVSASVTPNN
jgi:hypothetical protein